MSRVCPCCKEERPDDHFYKGKAKCKKCIGEVKALWRKNNPEKVKAIKSREYQNNREKYLKDRREYVEKHKEEILEKSKEYYKEHKEERYEYSKQWKERNKDKVRKYAENHRRKYPERQRKCQKDWQERNRDKCSEYTKKYRDNNHEKVSKENIRYKMERRKRDPLYNFKCHIRNSISIAIRRGGYSKTAKTTEIIGCSFEFFFQYLGLKPTEDAQLDHICPISQAKTEEEVILLQHYTNFQWLPASENIQKRDSKTPEAEANCLRLLGRPWID